MITTTPSTTTSPAVTTSFVLEGLDTEFPTLKAAKEAADDTCDGLSTEFYFARIDEIERDSDGEELDRTSHEVVITCHPTDPPCVSGQKHIWRSPHFLVGGLQETPGVFSDGAGVRSEYACLRCGCGRSTETDGQCPLDGSRGHWVVTFTPDEYSDQLGEEVEGELEEDGTLEEAEERGFLFWCTEPAREEEAIVHMAEQLSDGCWYYALDGSCESPAQYALVPSGTDLFFSRARALEGDRAKALVVTT